MERATTELDECRERLLFQSTPARDGAGDIYEAGLKAFFEGFQSTPARDGAGDFWPTCTPMPLLSFNPRPLAMERATPTAPTKSCLNCKFQSTPARDGAGDWPEWRVPRGWPCFNPRPLAMERATNGGGAQPASASSFNPRPLAMERATRPTCPARPSKAFQSTPARDGAGDHTPPRRPRPLTKFQSTPARDGAGDLGQHGWVALDDVSIHARSRWSGRRVMLAVLPGTREFQSTPARDGAGDLS